MSKIFTSEQLVELSAQVEVQLRELGGYYSLEAIAEPTARSRAKAVDSFDTEPVGVPPRQRKAIENTTKEDADSFFYNLTEKAKNVICDTESDLQKEYKTFGNLKKDELLDKLAGLMAAMGFAGATLHVLAVATAVYILHIGIKVFSEKYCK